MYYAFRGQLQAIKKEGIVLEVNNISYFIHMQKHQNLSVGQTYYIYLYFAINKENEQNLFGFIDLAEKELFLALIEISGIGPKTALNILSGGSIDDLLNAINLNNLKYFKNTPGVGPKTASQIIFALQGKYAPKVEQSPALLAAFEAAQALGFKQKEIQNAYEKVKNQISPEMNENKITMLILQNIK